MPTYAFVGSLASSPTILLNLDNQSPFSVVAGTQTPPPVRRSSTSSTAARDGDNVSQVSYADRIITIPLRVELRTTAEQQTEGIQKLARLLDGPQWLMWKHDGMIEPVWFRTKYGDMDVVDDILNETPRRTITLTIVAEPFAYGAAVSGTATIANDPSLPASSNPMSYVFPAIQGDVATPLSLKIPLTSSPLTYYSGALYATHAGPTVFATATHAAATSASANTGWSVNAAASDSAAIGGVATSYTRASGVSPSGAAVFTFNTNPGEYRLLIRARTTLADVSLAVNDLLRSSSRTMTASSAYRWYDMGVFRAPVASPPQSQPPSIAVPTAGAYSVTVAASTASTGTIFMDQILLVPAGLDSDLLARMLIVGTDFSLVGDTYIDSIGESAWIGALSTAHVLPVAGGFPAVLPGQANGLTIVPLLGRDDDKTRAIALTYQYYPRYLYSRPATT